jgi:hypothetical protein
MPPVVTVPNIKPICSHNKLKETGYVTGWGQNQIKCLPVFTEEKFYEI